MKMPGLGFNAAITTHIVKNMTKLGELHDNGQNPNIDKNARQVPWGGDGRKLL